MRLFYWMKLAQALITISLLVRILSTSQLCSDFISAKILEPRIDDESCKQLLKEMESVGMRSFSSGIHNAIRDSESALLTDKTRLGMFFSDVLKSWDKLWSNSKNSTAFYAPPVVSTELKPLSFDEIVNVSYFTPQYQASTSSAPKAASQAKNVMPANEKKQFKAKVFERHSPTSPRSGVPLKNETGFKQCLKVSFCDFFGFGPYRSNANKVLRLFSAPVFCILVYLAVVFVHALLQKSWPYRNCAMINMVICGFFWVFVLLSMYTIDYNWEKVWMSTGSFTPKLMDAILDAKIVSMVMILWIIIESIFNEHFAKRVQLKRVSNYYEVNERSSAGGTDEQEQYGLLSGDHCVANIHENSEALVSVVVPLNQD